jgi:hypothetical protein
VTISLVGTFGNGVNTGNVDVTLPTGISQGDAIGAVGICSTAQTLTAPAGWTVRAGFPADGGNARMYAWTKDTATAGDSGSVVTFISSAGNKIIVAGFVLTSGNGFPADWTDDLTYQAHATTSTAYTAPSSTSTVDNTWGVAVFGVRGTDPTPWTPAAGLTERQDLQRIGTGATSLHLCDAAGTIGPATTTWGPFTETNINVGNGGALTWLIEENTSGGGGGGGGGGGINYPQLGLWRQRTGTTWRQDMDAATATYGQFQGHWSQYYGAGELPISADVEQAFTDGHDLHIFWKPYDVSWADTAAGNYDTEVDAVAADVIALCAGTGRRIWLTLHHEPENDFGPTGFTAANWRAMWTQVRARFDTAGASQHVVWVAVFMNSHTNANGNGPGQDMITLWGNDGVMDDLVDVVSQQDYIAAGTTPSTIATKWIEDLEFLVDNDDTGRHWSYLERPQAFTEWGADLGGEVRGTNAHRAQTIAAIEAILPDLAARNVAEIRYFDARTNIIDDPPSVDGVAFQSLKDATEAGQGTGPVAAAGVALARDGATATASTIGFTLPAGWAQGDYAIVWLSSPSNPAVSAVPAGWALNEGPVSNSTTQRAWRYAKVLTAGEPDPTWTIDQSVRACGVMVVLRGMDPTSPEAATAALAATSSGTSHAAAALTLSDAYVAAYEDSYGGLGSGVAHLLTAWLFRWADASGNGGVNYGTPPGTHTTLGSASVDSDANPGAGALVAGLTANPITSGTFGTYTATVPVTSTGICGQVAIAAAPVAPPPPGTEFGSAVGAVTVVGTAFGVTIPAAAPAAGLIPDARVLVAFASQPMDPSPVFTTLPQSGVGAPGPVTVTHGRADEFSDVTPGTAAAELRNDDGRYTLGKTTGPHGANVKVGRRVRVQYLYQSGLYVRHDGHANAWPAIWPIGGGSYAAGELSSTDRLKRLGAVGELRSMLEEETLRDSPACYYPLGEGEGATSAGSVTPTPTAAAADWPLGAGGGTIRFGEGTGPGTDGLGAAIFAPQSATSGRHLRAVGVQVAAGSPGALSLSCWFNTTAVPSPNSQVLAALTTTAGDDAIILAVQAQTGQVQAFVIHDGWGAFGNVSPKAYNDGRTHHAALTLSRSSGGVVTVRLYVDGAQVQTGTYNRGPLGTFDELDVGGWHVTDFWAPFAGTLSHVAAYAGTALPVARILNQHQAGATGLAGERTDQRIARVADWIGLPASDRDLDIGDKRMGAQSTAGKQPLQVMAEAAAVEQGVLFVAPDGKLTFHRLSRRYNRASPDLTLDCASSGHVQVGLVMPGDDFGVVNDIEVTRAGGAAQRVINAASIDDYGLYRDSLEIPAFSDADAQAVGNWRVGNWGTPRIRVPNLTINLSRLHTLNPSLVEAILGLRISSLVRLTNLPTQAPGTSVDVFVEGWTEHIDVAGEWSITLNCSPADGYTVAVVGSAVVGTSRVAL